MTIGLGPAAHLPKRHYFNPELQNSRRGLGTEIVLEVDDVNAMFDRVKSSGHNILSPLQKRPWGATDFRIADPDGYLSPSHVEVGGRCGFENILDD